MPPTAALPEHVRALLKRDAYPRPPGHIELIQTHISYVFLADDEVFKVKKPVDLGFVDFTTLAKRQAACEKEVLLNRRGCSGDVYRGVLQITRDVSGRYVIGGRGEAVDYAVHMKRLPAERMMDHLLAQYAVDFDMIGRLAARVASLHQGADRSDEITRTGGRRTLASNWDETLGQMRTFAGRTLGKRRLDRIWSYAMEFLRAEAALLERREEEGWVRDCHGDMRSDAVCFDGSLPGGICIYDCIEFNDALRYGDTGLDVAFLAMDLDYRGRPDLSDLFIGLYVPAIGDAELPLLLDFYKCYRACVRGKVESLLSIDAGVAARKRVQARRRAQAYFRLAETYARRRAQPGLVMVSGPSGSGKSVLAGTLASRLGAALLSTDMLRRLLFEERGVRAAIDSGIYIEASRQRVYDAMLQDATRFLSQGRGVVLDGTFLERQQRSPFIDLAREYRQRFLIVECSAPDDVVRQRQAAREGQAWTASEGRFEVYLAQKQRQEPPTEVSPQERIAVNTTLALAEQLTAVEQKLAG